MYCGRWEESAAARLSATVEIGIDKGLDLRLVATQLLAQVCVAEGSKAIDQSVDQADSSHEAGSWLRRSSTSRLRSSKMFTST